MANNAPGTSCRRDCRCLRTEHAASSNRRRSPRLRAPATPAWGIAWWIKAVAAAGDGPAAEVDSESPRPSPYRRLRPPVPRCSRGPQTRARARTSGIQGPMPEQCVFSRGLRSPGAHGGGGGSAAFPGAGLVEHRRRSGREMATGDVGQRHVSRAPLAWTPAWPPTHRAGARPVRRTRCPPGFSAHGRQRSSSDRITSATVISWALRARR